MAGVALMAYCIPKLARSFGKDPGPAFVLAVLNPLTLLALVGGAHNDALMVALATNYVGFLVPKAALITDILLMVVILLWRPRGLYPVTSR